MWTWPPVRPASVASRGDHDLLGRPGDAAQAERRGVEALVRDAIALERGILAVVDDRQVEHARVLERAAHDQRARDRAPVVGDGHTPGGVQLGDVGELLARSTRA